MLDSANLMNSKSSELINNYLLNLQMLNRKTTKFIKVNNLHK